MDLSELEVRWKNFRGFQDTGPVKIKPITILIGANNSGKTSFLAPLLLLKQTYESHDPFIALKTVGDTVDAGSFEDIVFNHETELPVSFDITFHSHKHDPEYKLKPLGTIGPGRVRWEFTKQAEDHFINLRKYTVIDAEGRIMLSRSRLKSERYSLRGLNRMIDDDSKPLTDDRFDRRLRQNIQASTPHNFLFADDPFSESIREVALSDHPREISGFSSNYLKVVENVRQSIVDLLLKIDFIGPLRQRPARLYLHSGDLPENVGSEGENTAELLYQWGAITKGFIAGVERWLRKFDYDVLLKIQTLNKDAFSISLRGKKNSCDINFADTGFGLSQVLPLIVQSLFAKEYPELLITEQPEIHLNPKLQAMLADLFVEVANSGSHVLVETHSEHLLLRLRRLVAEEKIVAEKVAVYFVEKMDGASIIREIPIHSNGHIQTDRWPQGFFGESLRDALGLAMAQSRRKKNA